MVVVTEEYVNQVITEAGHTRATYEGPFPFPENTTEIGESAFNRCVSLKEIRIPNSVKQIGRYAFRICLNLERAILSKNVRAIFIGTFDQCKSLVAIVIPWGVKYIGPMAFSHCFSLRAITLPITLQIVSLNSFSESGHISFVVAPKRFYYSTIEVSDFESLLHMSIKEVFPSAKLFLLKDDKAAMSEVVIRGESTPRFLGPSMSRQEIDKALAREPFKVPRTNLLPSMETNLKWLDLSRKLFPRLPDEIRLIILDFINGNVTAGLTELLKTFDVSRAIAPAGALYDHTV